MLLHKSSVSNTGLSRADPILWTILPCQEVPPDVKPVVQPTLPPDMLLRPENKQAMLIAMPNARSLAAKFEFLISLILLGASAEDSDLGRRAHLRQ